MEKPDHGEMTNGRKIRVLCIGRSLAGGGAERVQIQLLEKIYSDLDISLFYLGNDNTLKSLIPSDVSVYFGTVGKKFTIKDNILSLLVLYKIAKGSDIIFGMQDTTPIYIASILGKSLNKFSVGWIHNTWSKKKQDVSSIHGILVPLIYPMVDRFVVVSRGHWKV
ncbi:hypothetical protein ACFQDE_18825 [Deinococcus caeni]|uniref:hypothetical protein n=1 Tax=Deinococcus caeni TaxID=569127 RepID=UPI003606B257